MFKNSCFVLAAMTSCLLSCNPATAGLLTIQDFVGDTQNHNGGIYSQTNVRLVGQNGYTNSQGLDYYRGGYWTASTSASDFHDAIGSTFNMLAQASVDHGTIRVMAQQSSDGSYTYAGASAYWIDWVMMVVPYENNDTSTLPSWEHLNLNLHVHAIIQGSIVGNGAAFAGVDFESSGAIYQLDQLRFTEGDGGPNGDPYHPVASFSHEFNYMHQIPLNLWLFSAQNGYAYYLTPYTYGAFAQAEAYYGESYFIADGWNTITLQSVTLPDGSTPESNGYTLQFGSGMTSPNLDASAVPEPGSLTLAGLGAIGMVVGAYRRRKLTA